MLVNEDGQHCSVVGGTGWELGTAGAAISRTWPQGSSIEFQPHREALAGCLATKAAEQEVDMCLSLVLYRNNVEAAISALSKGSFGSPEPQASELRLVARVHKRSDIDGRFYHVPCLSLVQEGVDGASQGGGILGGDCVEGLLGPSVSDPMWRLIEAEVLKVGWTITMDLFATASNARVERFCNRRHEPSAEHIDALSVPDWAPSLCPACRGRHSEVMYAFPPQALLRAVVRKAVQDGASIVHLVPLVVTSQQWHKLVQSSVMQNQDRDIWIRNPESMLENVAMFRASSPSSCVTFELRGMIVRPEGLTVCARMRMSVGRDFRAAGGRTSRTDSNCVTSS